MKRKILLILLVIVLIIAVGVGTYTVYNVFNSDQTIKTQTYDKKYTLVEEIKKNNVKMPYAKFYITNNNEEKVFICKDSYRTIDLFGVMLGEGTYDVWVLSSDVGVYCYRYINGEWIKLTSWDEYSGVENICYLRKDTDQREKVAVPAEQIPQKVKDYCKRIMSLIGNIT